MPATFVPEEASRVRTISQLKDLQATENRVVEVEGYHSPGDGGGGKFVWKQGYRSSTDEGLYFSSNRPESGAWERVVESDRKINVKWYGAIGDGNSDDTSPFEAVWNHISGKNGGIIVIPDGVYIVNTQLSLDNVIGVDLQGFGFKNSTIFSKHYDHGLKFTNSNGLELHNVSVQGEDGSEGIVNAFRFESCDQVILTNCFGEKSAANFSYSSCQNVVMHNCDSGKVVSRNNPSGSSMQISTMAGPPTGAGIISDNSDVKAINSSSEAGPQGVPFEEQNDGDINFGNFKDLDNGQEITTLNSGVNFNGYASFDNIDEGDVPSESTNLFQDADGKIKTKDDSGRISVINRKLFVSDTEPTDSEGKDGDIYYVKVTS